MIGRKQFMGVDWSKIHDQEKLTPAALPLAVFSFLYWAGLKLRTGSAVKKDALPGFVVSLGNLTVGGTGKTPAAAMLAEWSLARGYKPAVLSRGYGGKTRRKALEVSDGRRVLASAAEAGDEPYLLAKKLKGVPVIISKDRQEAGPLPTISTEPTSSFSMTVFSTSNSSETWISSSWMQPVPLATGASCRGDRCASP
jgi:tetraacyldisaccharide-1-P 4'-kinase